MNGTWWVLQWGVVVGFSLFSALCVGVSVNVFMWIVIQFGVWMMIFQVDLMI